MISSSSEILYFLQIAQTGNLSRAAERLGMSQPTLTLAVKRLEDALGVPLLIRSKNGVRLTRAGEQFAQSARQLVQQWERLKDDVLKSEHELRGRYIIGCHPSVALYSLPSFLPQLLSEHASLEFKLVHDLSRRVTEDVISFKVDFGIVVNPWEHPDLVIRPVARDEVCLWTAEEPSPLQDPKNPDCVLVCDPELAQSQSILKQLAAKDLHFRRVITSSNLEVITSLIAAKAGIGILPSRVASRLAGFRLKRLRPSPTFEDTIALIFRRDAQNSPGSRALVRRVEELFTLSEGKLPPSKTSSPRSRSIKVGDGKSTTHISSS